MRKFCFFQWWPVLLLLAGCTLAAPPASLPTATVTATPATTATVALPTPTPVAPAGTTEGRLIEMDGRTLFLTCVGDKKPTVLLEAGLGGDHTSWEQVIDVGCKSGC